MSRLCHMIKRDDFDGYGFNLHSERGKPGQYIGKVDDNSPAEFAGLKHGDRILEVNGIKIGNETHKQVVQRIKAITNEVRLLVVDPIDEKNECNVPQNKQLNNLHNNNLNNNNTNINLINNNNNANNLNNNNNNNNNSNNNNNNNVDDNDEEQNENNSTTATTAVIKASTSQKIDENDLSQVNDQQQHHHHHHHHHSNDAKANNDDDDDDDDDEIDVVDDKNDKIQKQKQQNGNGNGNVTTSTVGGSSIIDGLKSSTSSPTQTSLNENERQKLTGLNLPMTAAEMRQKLLAKKKYDPKNDTVDLRKKFDIIQKL